MSTESRLEALETFQSATESALNGIDADIVSIKKEIPNLSTIPRSVTPPTLTDPSPVSVTDGGSPKSVDFVLLKFKVVDDGVVKTYTAAEVAADQTLLQSIYDNHPSLFVEHI